MLYSEFLTGINGIESIYNYSEYERINAIYSASNSMTKEEAYKLYKAPEGVTLELIKAYENERDLFFDLYMENQRLKKEAENLKKELEETKRIRDAAQYRLDDTVAELKKTLNNIEYILND